MTISYNWVCEYLPAEVKGPPVSLDPDKLSKILTSVGLEVESLSHSGIKGGLSGLISGEVLTCVKHPDADKLKVTTVNTGNNILQIVCGASNIATGQKVIVAPIGTTIYPSAGGELLIKIAKIRGQESQGMICSEDEIGLGDDHSGIVVLPEDIQPGTTVADLFSLTDDYIFEIGLTPNRIDAMSHLGVARDVNAYLSHHFKTEYQVDSPVKDFDSGSSPIRVTIENTAGCKRYSGVKINGIKVAQSPEWLQKRLRSVGVKSINNIVDITNFILHETGQPLHAFDAGKISNAHIIVKNATENMEFKTLDDKVRKLSAADLMICDDKGPLCIAGVYGGMNSGVTEETNEIFLESAWFDPSMIRRTSLRHALRTDAASRFEKGTDISNTAAVLQHAANLITKYAGGAVEGAITDNYPEPVPKAQVGLKYHYLKKLSGKNYHGETVKKILKGLGFKIAKDGTDELRVEVPHSKPDIRIPADIVEEVMRIDGLDNVEIPVTISVSPAVDKRVNEHMLKEKIAGYLSGAGFYEIFTNSISSSALYSEEILSGSVKMINSLTSELDIMRPDMLQSGLQVIAYNINRKNADLQLYEFGKTYGAAKGKYFETSHISLYVSGNKNSTDWHHKSQPADFYHLKGIIERLLALAGITDLGYKAGTADNMENSLEIFVSGKQVGTFGAVKDVILKKADIRQPVYFADLNWELITNISQTQGTYREISKFPAAKRDLAIVVDKSTPFSAIEEATKGVGLSHLQSVQLFDIFESDKLGAGKKSMALNYTFSDDSRTLTDKDIDTMMNKLISSYEKQLKAEIRK